MTKLRRINLLYMLVATLTIALGIKVLVVPHEDPQLAANGTQGEDVDKDNTGSRFEFAELDLIPLSIPRGDDEFETNDLSQVGPRWIGTENPEAARLLDKARAALKAKVPEKALEISRLGLEVDPGFPQLLVTAAAAALACGDTRLAEAKLLARLAAVRAPMYSEAHYNVACAMARQNRSAEAASALKESVKWGVARDLNVIGQMDNDSDFDRVRQSREFLTLPK